MANLNLLGDKPSELYSMQITELSHRVASFWLHSENEGCVSSMIQFWNKTIIQNRHSVITLISV